MRTATFRKDIDIGNIWLIDDADHDDKIRNMESTREYWPASEDSTLILCNEKNVGDNGYAVTRCTSIHKSANVLQSDFYTRTLHRSERWLKLRDIDNDKKTILRWKIRKNIADHRMAYEEALNGEMCALASLTKKYGIKYVSSITDNLSELLLECLRTLIERSTIGADKNQLSKILNNFLTGKKLILK